MFVLRFMVLIVPLLAVAGCGESVGTGALAASGVPASAVPTDRICETATAIATGFGEEQVTRFAHDNLDLAIDKAKNELAQKGAKGFAIDGRNVRCGDYIDFGGALGREHKCRATARVCGKTA